MQVNLSYGVSPGNNGAASSVARQVSSGPGVSTSNLDSTRTRLVKRGSVVEFPGGASARVCRVRAGYFYTDVDATMGRHGCVYATAAVRVIA